MSLKPDAPYSGFSHVYDEVMGEVPYYTWANFIAHQLMDSGLDAQANILELAAGTGRLYRHLSANFPGWIQSDISPEMLKFSSGSPRLVTDMRQLPLQDNSLDAVVCVHDSVNYLYRKEDLQQHFIEIARVLKRGGIYIFDVTTERNVVRNFDKKTISEKHGDRTIEWKNSYNRRERIIQSDLIITQGKKSWHETHLQRVYRNNELENFIKKNNMQILRRTADYSPGKSVDRAKLVAYVVQKN